MTIDSALWADGSRYHAAQDDVLLGAIWPTGRLSGGAVTLTAGTMNVVIQPGVAVVPVGNGQSILCRWTAAQTITVPAGPAAGNVRPEIIVVRVVEADGEFVIERVAGTVALPAAAVAPAVPANAVALAGYWVQGGQANLNNAAVYPHGGGTLPGLHRVAMPRERTLAYVRLAAAQAEVVFTNIPTTGFRHLEIICKCRSTNASQWSGLQGQINGYTGANHNYVFVQASGTSFTVIALANANNMFFGNMPAASAVSNNDSGVFDITLPYSQDPGPPNIRNWLAWAYANSGTTDASMQQAQWRSGRIDPGSALPVTQLRLWPATGNFTANSIFMLIGKEAES